MPVKKFTYSWTMLLYGIGLPGFLIICIIVNTNRFNWLVCIIVAIALAIFMVYSCKKFLTYNLQIKTALILDADKLQYLHDNVIVYWSDIIKLDYTMSLRGGYLEYITLSYQCDENIVINTNLVEGKGIIIYKAITEYYDRSVANN